MLWMLLRLFKFIHFITNTSNDYSPLRDQVTMEKQRTLPQTGIDRLSKFDHGDVTTKLLAKDRAERVIGSDGGKGSHLNDLLNFQSSQEKAIPNNLGCIPAACPTTNNKGGKPHMIVVNISKHIHTNEKDPNIIVICDTEIHCTNREI